ncbi:MAG: hypothetical protein HRT71_21500 [Flavobacteriales bacterium]|nr:hypothetical protein [Flavobacteriales bacterium]
MYKGSRSTNEMFQLGTNLNSGVYILRVVHAFGIENLKLLKVK